MLTLQDILLLELLSNAPSVHNEHAGQALSNVSESAICTWFNWRTFTSLMDDERYLHYMYPSAEEHAERQARSIRIASCHPLLSSARPSDHYIILGPASGLAFFYKANGHRPSYAVLMCDKMRGHFVVLPCNVLVMLLPMMLRLQQVAQEIMDALD